jgi:hypothetical protein
LHGRDDGGSVSESVDEMGGHGRRRCERTLQEMHGGASRRTAGEARDDIHFCESTTTEEVTFGENQISSAGNAGMENVSLP